MTKNFNLVLPPVDGSDLPLKAYIDNASPVSVYLVNGIKLTGILVWKDKEVAILRNGANDQPIYIHAIATICCGSPTLLF